jgi:glycylpeptide N-tetradecanoyltransferase
MAESTPVGAPTVESESENEEVPEQQDGQHSTSADGAAAKKKKKSKRKKVASAITGDSGDPSRPAAKISQEGMQQIMDANPALKGELSKMSPEAAQEMLKKMDVNQLLTGLSLNGRNQKDMASYKFWSTQPVPRLDEKPGDVVDGPIKEVDPERVPKDPAPLPEGFEWVLLDLNKDDEIKEVYELLTDHYVEDGAATFRFDYSKSFLDWALKAPGWQRDWHIGVRVKKAGGTGKLIASIFGIPTKLRVRKNILDVVEINFLCVHKKLRDKRLAPVLIKEVTRRVNLRGIYQAIYTGGTILPTPVSSCRYYHRSLNWLKLYEVGFSPLPPHSTKQRMITRNALPDKTSTKGWRAMGEKDIDAVLDLLSRYLKRTDLAQEFTREEIEHWLIDRTKSKKDRVVWAFVVEDSSTGRITDFSSFYSLESSVLGDAAKIHSKIYAAYLFYYASETAFEQGEKGLKERLQQIMTDTLIEAKNVSFHVPFALTECALLSKVHVANLCIQAKFDVCNALTLMDNPFFLEQLKFGAGDGQLHYYLFNWRTTPVSGGIDKRMTPDEEKRNGVGIVML